MSSSKKLVVVFGATGNQGGSIVSTWANDSNLKTKYAIRAITRDTSKPSAKALESGGAEVVAADLNDASSLKHAVEGAYAVFAVTNYWEFMNKDKELAQGKAIADASFAASVKHLVWSSLPHTTKLTNGALPQIDHFVAKAEVEEYIEAHKSKSSTMATYFMPGFFMSNFRDFINPGQDGVPTYAVAFPPGTPHGLIDIKHETGGYVWGALEAGERADGKEIQAVSEWVSAKQITETLTEYAGAGQVTFTELPREVFKGFMVQKMGDYVGEEMTQNMDLIKDYHYYGKGAENHQAGSDKFLLEGWKKTSFKEWVEQNKPWKFGK